MAFGVTIGFSRLGSILNFFLTLYFEQEYGLLWTLWGGRSTTRVLTERTHMQGDTQGFGLQAPCCVFWVLESPSSPDSWTRLGSSS